MVDFISHPTYLWNNFINLPVVHFEFSFTQIQSIQYCLLLNRTFLIDLRPRSIFKTYSLLPNFVPEFPFKDMQNFLIGYNLIIYTTTAYFNKNILIIRIFQLLQKHSSFEQKYLLHFTPVSCVAVLKHPCCKKKTPLFGAFLPNRLV